MKKHLVWLAAGILAFTACQKEDLTSPVVSSSVSSNAVTVKGKRIYFTQPGNYINGNTFSYSPGDTFVLKSGIDYTYFSMGSVKNVTIINEGGIVHLTNGFDLGSCENVTVTGTGTKDFYGFEISGHTPGDVGFNVNGKSKNITITHLYIHDKTYGGWVKQEVGGTNDESLYYPNWYMDSITITHCMIKRMNQEGLYIGSTGQNADRPNKVGEYPYPMRLSNVTITNMIIDSTNRGGIMLSGADRGVNTISNNKITRCGYEYNSYQGNGVVIGGNAYANITNNVIKNTLCDGIWVLGVGTTRVKNNIIDSSGWLDGVNAGFMHGVAFDVRPSYPFRTSTFRIRGNDIGKHTDGKNDIYIYNSSVSDGGKKANGYSDNNLIFDNNNGKARFHVESGVLFSEVVGD